MDVMTLVIVGDIFMRTLYDLIKARRVLRKLTTAIYEARTKMERVARELKAATQNPALEESERESLLFGAQQAAIIYSRALHNVNEEMKFLELILSNQPIARRLWLAAIPL